jgi:hypothetical protein
MAFFHLGLTMKKPRFSWSATAASCGGRHQESSEPAADERRKQAARGKFGVTGAAIDLDVAGRNITGRKSARSRISRQ